MERMTPVVPADDCVLVFGGPCSNLQATEAVLAEARRLGIPPRRIVCTGDLAAYCGEPAATIELIRASGIHVVMGNCDEQLGAGAADCACGFIPGSACETLSAAWFAHADREVRADARAWLAALPRRIDLQYTSRSGAGANADFAGIRLAVIHGGIASINEFIFASTDARIKTDQLTLGGADGIIGGHCGLPFTQTVNGRLWHNAGIVGVPANDGTPRAWFSLLIPRDGGLDIEHRALIYDHTAAAYAMQRADLPPDYRLTLTSGLWPSCDVLPYPEIVARGAALEPGTTFWRPTPPPLPAARPKRRRKPEAVTLWPTEHNVTKLLQAQKFKDPQVTAKGEPRATVPLVALETLWFNTGTQCNITCRNCYIESSPTNDRLVYLTVDDIRPYLDEIERDRLGTTEIGFTGGEPFLNPHMLAMLDVCLSRGFRVLLLTNAMRPMQRLKPKLVDLNSRHGSKLTIRVSLDHYTAGRHEEERGAGTFQPTLDGLRWLAANGFKVAVAGRTMWGEDQAAERAGYQRLFAEHRIAIDASSAAALVLFPEMDARLDVPEITTACWGILGKSPEDVMCATSRMVVRRKGAERAAVLSCTLLPYDPQFEMGATLREASRAVPLNHAHCARFCVLGGASCSPAAEGSARCT